MSGKTLRYEKEYICSRGKDFCFILEFLLGWPSKAMPSNQLLCSKEIVACRSPCVLDTFLVAHFPKNFRYFLIHMSNGYMKISLEIKLEIGMSLLLVQSSKIVLRSLSSYFIFKIESQD